MGLLRIVYKKYFRPIIIRISTSALERKLFFCGIRVRFRGERFVSKPQFTFIGNNVHIGDNAYFKTDGGLLIGDNVIISRNVTIYTVNHKYDGAAIPYDETRVKRPVVIDDNVWIGMNVSIVPGVKIGEGAVIGMGSVVVKDVPPLAIVGGNPSQILKYRDKDKYSSLKAAMQIGNHKGKILSAEVLKNFKQGYREDFLNKIQSA